MATEIGRVVHSTLAPDPTPADIYARIKQDGVQFIYLQFTDVMGLVKGITIPAHTLHEVVERGQWFDGSSIAGFAEIAESDMFLVPDLSTYAVIPWERGGFKTARFICWVYTPNNMPFCGDPRRVLQNQVDKLAALGYTFNTGPEMEFFLFDLDDNGRISPLPHDRGSYFDFSADLSSTVSKDMVRALIAMGIDVECIHHENAAGQHEIDFEYGRALSSADRAVTFKSILKAIAQQHGLHATFMPKPMEGSAGSGMHVHQSFGFVDTDRGTNAFADETDPFGLSKIAKHFIAGQLKHARALTAVVAPLVNSYHRLVPGYEAPVYVSWARTNRSTLIRVPSIRQGNYNATRVELRCPDPSCNPYLAFAAMLAAGMDGIVNELPLEAPIEENLYHFTRDELRARNISVLPASLGEAIEAFQADDVVRTSLGGHTAEQLIERQSAEWDVFRTHVTQWERDRYLEVY